jgi:anti-sigma regulatory factor (Ser/Thr protein kinase)
MAEAVRVEAEVQLMPHPKSVRVARRFCALTLTRFGLACCIETARLVVSELVTNAVLHAHTPIGLRFEICGDELRIEVRDGFAEMTTTPRVIDVRDLPESGRGLLVVEALGGRWGWDQTRAGKVVWCEVPVNALV